LAADLALWLQIDGLLRPGLTSLTWSSINLDRYFDCVKSGIDELSAFFYQVTLTLQQTVTRTQIQLVLGSGTDNRSRQQVQGRHAEKKPGMLKALERRTSATFPDSIRLWAFDLQMCFFFIPAEFA